MAEDDRRWVVLALAALLVAVAAFVSVDRTDGWPRPDAPSYAQLADNMVAGDGYRVDIAGEPEGSRYPPGFPILLVLLTPFGASGAAVLLGGGFATAVWASAWKAGGPIAATVAVLSVALYLPRHQFAGAVMSDTSAALFLLLALLALQCGRPMLMGFLAGFGVWVKLAHATIGVALPRRAVMPFAAGCVGLLATKLALGWGYSDGHTQWALRHVWSTEGLASPEIEQFPNVVAYPLMVLGLHGSIAPPGAGLLAGWALWRRPERRFVLLSAVGLLVVYVPYFYQASRFMFPVVGFVAVYAGCGVAQLLRTRASTANSSDASAA